MIFIALIVAIVSVFNLDSAIRNRHPIKYLKAVLDEPERAWELSSEMAGTWVAPVSVATPTGAAKHFTDVGSNGRLSEDQLQRLSWDRGEMLVPAAANALEALNVAFKERFGRNIQVTDSYRTLGEQAFLRVTKGTVAAAVGKSVHGWGRAVDLGGGIDKWGSPERRWMEANAGAFGWFSPAWAQQGQETPEPWHWEFRSA